MLGLGMAKFGEISVEKTVYDAHRSGSRLLSKRLHAPITKNQPGKSAGVAGHALP
jgi:hypothetical protein